MASGDVPQNLTVTVTRDGDRYVALVLETGVSSFGDTPSEALGMVSEAMELALEDTQ